MVAQSIVAEFCDSGAIERSIETVKEALRERRDATADALERHIPGRALREAAGRLLPLGRPARGQRRGRARGRRGGARASSSSRARDFLIEGGDSSLRIAYSAVPPDQIEEGIARVAEAYRELAGAAA